MLRAFFLAFAIGLGAYAVPIGRNQGRRLSLSRPFERVFDVSRRANRTATLQTMNLKTLSLKCQVREGRRARNP
jgi:hypothetical protein